MRAVPVPQKHIATVWDRIVPWVERACRRGDGSWTVSAARQQVDIGNGALWLALGNGGLHGFAITTTEKWPDGTITGVVMMAGGNIGRHVNGMLPDLELWAKAWGATRMIVRGRKGWIRALEGYRMVEYQPGCVTVLKELH